MAHFLAITSLCVRHLMVLWCRLIPLLRKEMLRSIRLSVSNNLRLKWWCRCLVISSLCYSFMSTFLENTNTFPFKRKWDNQPVSWILAEHYVLHDSRHSWECKHLGVNLLLACLVTPDISKDLAPLVVHLFWLAQIQSEHCKAADSTSKDLGQVLS